MLQGRGNIMDSDENKGCINCKNQNVDDDNMPCVMCNGENNWEGKDKKIKDNKDISNDDLKEIICRLEIDKNNLTNEIKDFKDTIIRRDKEINDLVNKNSKKILDILKLQADLQFERADIKVNDKGHLKVLTDKESIEIYKDVINKLSMLLNNTYKEI